MTPTRFLRVALAPSAVLLLAASPVGGQELSAGESDVEARLERLEARNAELRRQVEVLGGEFERVRLGDVMPAPADRYSGLGPAASKVYQKEDGLSIGGYGEAVYTTGSDVTDTFDFVRNVLYFGYKFDEEWVFNSEIEVEHADEIFLEFAYLDYLHDPAFNARAGMVLLPLGFLNELHEPTTFYGALRPETERVIIPSTWRENGVGAHGDVGPLSYRAYVTNGFRGENFSTGLRGGRQKGSQALAEDLALSARVDWTRTPGLLAGVGAYYGDSGQDATLDPDGGGPLGPQPIGDLGTTIVDLHVEYQYQALRLRGLYAMADLTGVGTLNALKNAADPGSGNVGSEMDGWYLEAGYDVMSELAPDTGQALIPFVRWEEVDTRADLGATADDREFLTFGVNYQPIPEVVVKLDLRQTEDALGGETDEVHFSIGYVF